MNSSRDNLAGRTLAELGPFGWHKQSTGLFASRLSTRCVVPSRQGVLSLSTTCPAVLVCTRSSVLGRARDGAAQLLKRLAVVGSAAHGGVQGEARHKGPEGALCLPNAKARYKRLG